MRSNVHLTRIVFSSVLVMLSLSVPVVVNAQQKQLSVEELEAYIAEQKVVLEKAQANRDKTQKKVDEVKAALAEQDARKARVEKELEALCKEQEALEPGTYEDCKSHSDN